MAYALYMLFPECTPGESVCLVHCGIMYLSLQYALKCDGRANSGLVWLNCESIYTYIDLNISCIYSGGGGEGEAKTIYMSVVYMYILENMRVCMCPCHTLGGEW